MYLQPPFSRHRCEQTPDLPRRHTLPLIACLPACTATGAATYTAGTTAVEAVDAAGAATGAEIDAVAETKVGPVGEAVSPRELEDAALPIARVRLRPGGGIPSPQEGIVADIVDDAQTRCLRLSGG